MSVELYTDYSYHESSPAVKENLIPAIHAVGLVEATLFYNSTEATLDRGQINSAKTVELLREIYDLSTPLEIRKHDFDLLFQPTQIRTESTSEQIARERVHVNDSHTLRGAILVFDLRSQMSAICSGTLALELPPLDTTGRICPFEWGVIHLTSTGLVDQDPQAVANLQLASTYQGLFNLNTNPLKPYARKLTMITPSFQGRGTPAYAT